MKIFDFIIVTILATLLYIFGVVANPVAWIIMLFWSGYFNFTAFPTWFLVIISYIFVWCLINSYYKYYNEEV